MEKFLKVAPFIIMTVVFSLITSCSPSSNGAKFEPPDGKVYHGAWMPYHGRLTEHQIESFEKLSGKELALQVLYIGWNSHAFSQAAVQMDVFEPMGITAHIVWEPFLQDGADPLESILSGKEDEIIDNFAKGAKARGTKIFLRWAHEMNGDWYPWSGAKTGKNPQKYVDAWRYIYNRFQEIGADNVAFVWCPNADSVPNGKWNNMHNFYPGDEYVDWVGIDFYGLQWGNGDPHKQIAKVYTKYADRKPLMIGETAAADPDHYAANVTMTKPQWITALFKELKTNYPRVKAINWFNHNKEADWRINSEPKPQALNAYREGIGDPRYISEVVE